MAERIVWVGGYPRVVGVNLPETQPEPPATQSSKSAVAQPPTTSPILPINGNIYGGYQGHDLRAGLQRTNSKPKP